MPEKRTLKRARQDEREGKAASTQAGEFVHEEIEHVRKGKHGARSTKQAIAIGLSKARRAGVDLPPPKAGEASEKTRRKARKDVEAGKPTRKAVARKTAAKRTMSKTRSRATTKALKHEGRAAASRSALSKQAKTASRKRTASERSATAKKAARTKGAEGRSAAAKKAARTRARHEGRGRHNGATAHA